MFESNVREDDPALLRLQKDVARDRLRLKQCRELVDHGSPVEDAPSGSTVGRLYRVFVAMGEA